MTPRPFPACASLALIALAAPLASPSPARSPSSPAAPPPRLVLVVAVDQMRADYLERFRPLFTAGLKRLAEGGAVFTRAMYRHACTETGPGHSVLLSGRSPRSSGIVGNVWYDRTLRQRVNVVDDPAVRLIGSNRGRAASMWPPGISMVTATRTSSSALMPRRSAPGTSLPLAAMTPSLAVSFRK